MGGLEGGRCNVRVVLNGRLDNALQEARQREHTLEEAGQLHQFGLLLLERHADAQLLGRLAQQGERGVQLDVVRGVVLANLRLENEAHFSQLRLKGGTVLGLLHLARALLLLGVGRERLKLLELGGALSQPEQHHDAVLQRTTAGVL